jgi:hypothetical protein
MFSVLECVHHCLAQDLAEGCTLLYVHSLFSAHSFDFLNSPGRPAIGIYQNWVWQNGFSHCSMQVWEEHLRRLFWHEFEQLSPQGKHVSSCGLFVFYMACGP